LQPLAFPKFPTVAELVEELGRPASSSDRPRGLFEELLLSRPEELYLDALEHPEKYDPQVLPLTRELISLRRKPTEAERRVLDRAVLDLTEAPRQKAAPVPRRAPPPPAERPREAADPFPELEGMKPFWWL